MSSAIRALKSAKTYPPIQGNVKLKLAPWR